ncbi:MAG: GTPase [Planctomycetota bacterium]
MTRLHLATASTPGAIALLQLHGQDTPRILSELTGRADWRAGRVALCSFAEIDEGLAVLMDRGDNAAPWAQLMPHGGPRVVQRLIDHLLTLGCTFEPQPDPRDVYPEAGSAIGADMLHAIANAASPAAIDLLAAQPGRWRGLLQQTGADETELREAISQRSRVLDRLITPPTVVVAGRANVGKSTLTNALSGRAVSIVADLPGTTRDWVGTLVELRSGLGSGVSGLAGGHAPSPNPETPDPAPEVAVQWLDTPGLRVSDDTVEQRAISLARSVVKSADVLIAMRDVLNDWPEPGALPRTPDLWVLNKCDGQETVSQSHDGSSPDRPLRISAEHGHGLPTLQHEVLQRLGLGLLQDEAAHWAFSTTLRAWAAGEPVDLDRYLQP